MSECVTEGCKREARMAVTTKRPTREKMYSTVYYDDRTAPKSAPAYCKACGVATVKALAETLVDMDEEVKVDAEVGG